MEAYFWKHVIERTQFKIGAIDKHIEDEYDEIPSQEEVPCRQGV